MPVVTCPDLFATTPLPADSLGLQQNLVHLWMHISLSLKPAQGIAHGAFCSALHSYVHTVLWLSRALHSEITPADREVLFAAVRYLSFVFACGKACDKIVLLARMVESDPWIGKSSRLTSKMPWQLWQNQKATSAPAELTKAS